MGRNRRPMETTLRGLALDLTTKSTSGGPTFPTEPLHDSVYEGDAALEELGKLETFDDTKNEDVDETMMIDTNPIITQKADKQQEANKRAKQRAERQRKDQMLALVATQKKDISSENWMP